MATPLEIRGGTRSRDSTLSSPNSQVSSSSHEIDDPALGKVKQVIACCRRHIGRFAGVSRNDIIKEDGSEASSSCFELRRPKSNSLPLQAQRTRTRRTRPPPLNLRQESYHFYMDEDNHPFITTPSCMEEDNSPKLTTFVTPPSR